MSFQQLDLTCEVEIPVGNHVGAFGVSRKFDVHRGVDLYCPEGAPVFAVEDGRVVIIEPWTGDKAGYPWWENTEAVLVEGETGCVAYGEIAPNPELKEDHEVKRGDLIGFVKRVLKKDKGRPRSMLHLQVYKHGLRSSGGWDVGSEQPDALIDPTIFLLTAAPNR